MRKSVHLIGYFHIYVSQCTIQRMEKIACLACDRVFAPYFFSNWYSNTLSHKNKFKYEIQIHYPIKTNLNMNASLFKNFWYYMYFQIRGYTFNISHTSFWYDIKACVLQHLGKDITLL